MLWFVLGFCKDNINYCKVMSNLSQKSRLISLFCVMDIHIFFKGARLVRFVVSNFAVISSNVGSRLLSFI